MLLRKNRLAITSDAKQRTVGFPDDFADKVSIVLSAEKKISTGVATQPESIQGAATVKQNEHLKTAE